MERGGEPPQRNGNGNTFTFSAVYNLSPGWAEAPPNTLAVIYLKK